jgi:hypothetical protein
MGDYANYARDLFKAAGFIYIAICLAAFAMALLLPKRWWGKLIAVSIVIALASILPLQAKKELDQNQAKADEFKQRYEKAKALFDERCKTAGEKIYRTVEGVEGLLLMKARPKEINFSDQYSLSDPYGADCWGDSCITDLLKVSQGNEKNLSLAQQQQDGFTWIDANIDAKTTRHTGVIRMDQPHRISLQQIQATANARYGLTWDDISTKQDRDFWIAGGQLRIIDLETNQVIAERRGYMMDSAQGNQIGGRSPWAFAYDNACPSFPKVSDGRAIRVGHTKKFVLAVIKPK